MQQTSEQYDAIIQRCRELFVKKMKDYGSAWRILRLPSLTDQIFIKAQRIRSLQQNDVRKVDEDEKSEFIGIINYSIMALIQIEKGVVEQPDLNTKQASVSMISMLRPPKVLWKIRTMTMGKPGVRCE